MCESLGQLKSRIGDYFGQVLDDLLVFESHRVLADHGDCFLFKERQVDNIKRVV